MVDQGGNLNGYARSKIIKLESMIKKNVNTVPEMSDWFKQTKIYTYARACPVFHAHCDMSCQE